MFLCAEFLFQGTAVSKPPFLDAACHAAALTAVVAAAVAGGRGLLEPAAGKSGSYTWRFARGLARR
jgi:hypothetical protein